MAAASARALAAAVSALLAVAVLLASPALLPAAAEEGCTRRPVVFAFGDSNTDTGGTAAALGSYLPLPEGRTHFRRSTGRLCDGRLIIDYLCKLQTQIHCPRWLYTLLKYRS